MLRVLCREREQRGREAEKEGKLLIIAKLIAKASNLYQKKES